jgi:predicted RNA-binding Zn ribbon-like protein
MPQYPGPIRQEPLAIELHNTLYADRGRAVDGLADAAGLRAWLHGVADRLAVDAGSVDTRRLPEFVTLRAAVREALAAKGAIPGDALAELNRASAHSPASLRLTQHGGEPHAEIHHHAPTATDVALGNLAASAIALVSGPHAGDLLTCGAPGCVLMFLRDRPRREWCCAACGNRARQARHYARRPTRP